MAGKNKRLREAGSSNASANASTSNTGDSDKIARCIDDALSGSSSSSNVEALFRTVAESLKKLGETMARMDSMFDRFNERLESMEEKLRCTEKERDTLAAENVKLKNELEYKSYQLEMEVENRERHQRRFNVKINGVELEGKNNTEIVESALKLHNEQSDKQLLPRDVYDITVFKGRQSASNTDTSKRATSTVILAMQSMESKAAFLMAGKRIHERHTSVYVGEDLTVGQRKLLYELKQRKDLFQKAVFRDNAVRCLKIGGGWQQFAYLRDLQKLPKRTTDSARTDD